MWKKVWNLRRKIMPVNIHGKQYITVAERLAEAREDLVSINTEVIPNGGSVVIKATVVTKKGTFTGISAANPNKSIEKQSPYEVAETSAVGRALGFAGYGVIDSIASADEIVKAQAVEEEDDGLVREVYEDRATIDARHQPRTCSEHQVEMERKISVKTDKAYWSHRENGQICFGKGLQ